ncbi:MAG: GC-type dockerin domain-anchored protein, partial [Planctomycetota bacterium]
EARVIGAGVVFKLDTEDARVDVDRLGVSDGSRDADTNALLFDECVFGVELENNARTDDPGFDTDAGAFPPSASIGYAYRAALREWDGSSFDAIPDERIRMSFGPLQGISTPLADPADPIEGLFIGVSSNGEYHNHFVFRLELDGSPATGVESQGVYLLELEFRIDSGIYAPTEPFWLVINNGADSGTFDEAADFARNQISPCGDAPTCPGDVNDDGSVDGSDFFAWVSAFGSQSPSCDVNGDTLCDGSDFFAWVSAFGTGC